MIAYKGFAPGLKCRGYQFVMGKNVTEKANCGANGFHCAEDPLDCLTYYPNLNNAEYYIVDAAGDIDEDAIDSKISCTEMTILQKLSNIDLFLHGLAFMVDHPLREWSSHVSKDKARAESGYAVVRGIDPIACGKTGDILSFVKEDVISGEIKKISIAEVDGIVIMPDTWYDVDFQERQVGLL